MLKQTTRRWLAGLGVAGALVAASATPAAAEEGEIELDLYFPDTTIAAGSAGKIEYPTLYSSEPVVLRDVTVRYDFTDLAGKVTVAEEDGSFPDCTSPEANVLLCSKHSETGLDEWRLAGLFRVVIAATDGAKDGDSGTLKVTLRAAGFDAVTHVADIRVGEGVDLAAGPRTEISAKPGEKFSAPLTVRNAGETTAKGASVVFYNDYGIRATKRYSNCTYDGDLLRTCQFKDDLTPGASYSASLGYALAPDTYAPGSQYGEIVWMTPAEFEDFNAYLDDRGVSIGKPGTDGELTLAEASAKAMAGITQADTKPNNNYSSVEVTVTGKNGADFAAIGDTVSGAAGDVVTATVGLVNKGPAVLDATRSGSAVTRTHVTIPAGTTAVDVPESCTPMKGDQVDWENAGKGGAAKYRCYSGPFLAVGATETVELKLRIDKVIANASGTVTINGKCACEGITSDLDASNDVAYLVVNESEGTGGGLPVTGASTGVIVGAGAVLLAAGGFAFVLARRRRMRFVA